MLKEVSKNLIKNYSSQILPQMELSTNKMALIKQQTFTQNLLNSASIAGHNGLPSKIDSNDILSSSSSSSFGFFFLNRTSGNVQVSHGYWSKTLRLK